MNFVLRFEIKIKGNTNRGWIELNELGYFMMGVKSGRNNEENHGIYKGI
jgi:hypothetical protein